jgi:DNA-binding NarL/FixJ family response regulator
MDRVMEMNKPLRVLLVDGHRGVRVALCERLRHVSRAVDVVASDGLAAAMNLLGELVPDVVVCDPRTVHQGADAVRQLGSGGCPVVVLTSSLQDGEAEDLRRSGAAAVLLKGCSLIALLATLETVVAAHHRKQHSQGPLAGSALGHGSEELGPV